MVLIERGIDDNNRYIYLRRDENNHAITIDILSYLIDNNIPLAIFYKPEKSDSVHKQIYLQFKPFCSIGFDK